MKLISKTFQLVVIVVGHRSSIQKATLINFLDKSGFVEILSNKPSKFWSSVATFQSVIRRPTRRRRVIRGFKKNTNEKASSLDGEKKNNKF